jgi:hypothetical protein
MDTNKHELGPEDHGLRGEDCPRITRLRPASAWQALIDANQKRELFPNDPIPAVVKPPLLWLYISVYSRLPGRSLGEGWPFAG